MNDITRLIPVEVPVTLGGRKYLASELRTGDFAELQQYIKNRVPCPTDVAYPLLATNPGSLTWKRVLSDTMDRQKEYPPLLGSEEANDILFDREGLPFFTWVILRRSHPELSYKNVAAIVNGASTEELVGLMRAAWSVDPMNYLVKLMDDAAEGPEEDDDPDPRDWAATWYAYCTKCSNGPQFDQLTMTQLIAFECEGQIPEPGHLVAKDMDPHILAKMQRRMAFWAELDDPEQAAEWAKAAVTTASRAGTASEGGA